MPLAGLTVVATSDDIARLRSATEAAWADEVTMLALDLDKPIPDEAIDRARAIVIQVDRGEPASMRRIEQVRARRHDLPQIVALANADLAVVRALLRQGVSDVVSLPLDPEEILQASLTAIEGRKAPEASGDRAPLVAIVRSLGGSGATTLLTHLANRFVEAEAQGSRGVCIMDLDVQFGSVTDVLGLSPRRNLTDLLEAGERIDGHFLRSVVSTHKSGLSIIAAPDEIVPLETIETEQLLNVIETARREFDCVFLDLPSDWSNWSLSVMLQADSILMVVEQSVSSLKQAMRRLELLKSVGIQRSKISIVVNRVEKRLFGSISLSDIADTLRHDVLVGLHAEWQTINAARDQGLLVNELKPKSTYYSDVKKLAELLNQRLPRRDGTS